MTCQACDAAQRSSLPPFLFGVEKWVTVPIFVLLLAGCGGGSGWVIKPAPVDETLAQSFVRRENGLFESARIVVLDVDGVILNDRSTGWMGSGENPVSLFVEKVDKAQADPAVRGVVVRINSPGGGVTASDVMYRRLVEFRRARPDVPVIAVIEDIGASGGYYLACASDTILCYPTGVTGSIGVIVQTLSLAGTMKLLGVSARAVTSGKHKDMASPFKPLAEDDLAILQGIVDELYDRFLSVVGRARKNIPKDKLRALADGRVYTARQALASGLIDKIGYLDDAIDLAKRRAGLKHADVVLYHRPLGQKATAYSQTPPQAPQINLLNVHLGKLLPSAQPRFLYLWTGKR